MFTTAKTSSNNMSVAACRIKSTSTVTRRNCMCGQIQRYSMQNASLVPVKKKQDFHLIAFTNI